MQTLHHHRPGGLPATNLLREANAMGLVSPCRVFELETQLDRRLARRPWTGSRRNDQKTIHPPERLVLDGYVLGSQLGRGGMAAVHLGRAVDGRQPERVAIKLLSLCGADSAIHRKRFLLELCATLEIDSPHLVTVYGSGYIGHRPYIVMELMPDGDLEAELHRRGQFERDDLLQVMSHVADGAQDIADAGLVHRDIKPSNLFRDPRCGVKIGDLGLVKRLYRDDQLSFDETTVGTPDYMCPEQVSGDVPTTAWDVYGLGVTMFYLASGRMPYTGSRAMVVMSNILLGNHARLQDVAPHVDPGLRRVVETAMAYDASKRYRCPAEFAEDCRRLLGGKAARGRHRTFGWLRSLAKSA